MSESFVVDNSVVMSWCFKDETNQKDLLALARAHNLSSYDASYLDLSMRKGLPLATLDTRLREAAKKTDVPILMD
jgi:predicted nucleic acid-binding protein